MPLPRVTRSGANLQTNGVTRRFAGANAYWLALNDNTLGSGGVATIPSTAVVKKTITEAKAMGFDFLRVHSAGISYGNPGGKNNPVLMPSIGTYNEGSFVAVDRILYEAEQAGMYIGVPFTDRWDFYHGGAVSFAKSYEGTTGNTDAYYRNLFQTDNGCITAFENYLTVWFNRTNTLKGIKYKDDTTFIFAEEANEYYDMPLAWQVRIAAKMKALAPSLLVADATQAHAKYVTDSNVALNYNSSTQVSNPDPNIDIFGGHFYPRDHWKLESDQPKVTAAGRAYMIGEYDWTPTGQAQDGKDNSTGANIDIQAWLNQIRDTPGINLTAMWSILVPEAGIHRDGYELYIPRSSGENAVQQNGYDMLKAQALAINPAAVAPVGGLVGKLVNAFQAVAADVKSIYADLTNIHKDVDQLKGQTIPPAIANIGFEFVYDTNAEKNGLINGAISGIRVVPTVPGVSAFTVQAPYLQSDDYSAGTDAIIDIQKKDNSSGSWTSLYGTGAKPTLPKGSTFIQGAAPQVSSCLPGDQLRAVLIQAPPTRTGSGTAATRPSTRVEMLNNGANTSTFSAFPTGGQVGDGYLAVIVTNGNVTLPTLPVGWRLVYSQTTTTNGRMTTWVFEADYNASTPPALTWTWSASTPSAGFMDLIRGADLSAGNFAQVVAGDGVEQNFVSGAYTFPSLAANRAGDLLYDISSAYYVAAAEGYTQAWTNTPAGFTELTDIVTTRGNTQTDYGLSVGVSGAVASGATVPGPTVTVTGTGSLGNSTGLGIRLLIRRSPGVHGPTWIAADSYVLGA